MDSRLALMFAALLLSTATGTLHIMFGSAQTENIAYAYVLFWDAYTCPNNTQKHIFSHATAVLYVYQP